MVFFTDIASVILGQISSREGKLSVSIWAYGDGPSQASYWGCLATMEIDPGVAGEQRKGRSAVCLPRARNAKAFSRLVPRTTLCGRCYYPRSENMKTESRVSDLPEASQSARG